MAGLSNRKEHSRIWVAGEEGETDCDGTLGKWGGYEGAGLFFFVV